MSQNMKTAIEIEELLKQKKLDNRETADVLRLVVNRLGQINKNQLGLNRQNESLAGRTDRMERLVLDQPKEGGGVRSGVATSLQETQKTLSVVQEQLSAIMLNQKTLERVIPWMIREQNVRDEPLTDEDVVKAAADIHRALKDEGDAAVANWSKVEKIGKASSRCSFCAHWKEAPAIQVPGQERKAGCGLKFIQVSCPGCQATQGPPVNPNDITGECSKCKTKLVREMETKDGGRLTMCGSFKTNRKKLREAMKAEEIPQEMIDSIVPKTSAADGE